MKSPAHQHTPRALIWRRATAPPTPFHAPSESGANSSQKRESDRPRWPLEAGTRETWRGSRSTERNWRPNKAAEVEARRTKKGAKANQNQGSRRLTGGCCEANPERLVEPCLELNLFHDSANLPRLALRLLRLPSSSLSEQPFSAWLGLRHFFPISVADGARETLS